MSADTQTEQPGPSRPGQSHAGDLPDQRLRLVPGADADPLDRHRSADLRLPAEHRARSSASSAWAWAASPAASRSACASILLPLVALTLLLAMPLTRDAAGQHHQPAQRARRPADLGARPSADGLHDACCASSAGLALTFGLMVLIWEMFVPIGRLLGRLMDDQPASHLGLFGQRRRQPARHLAVRRPERVFAAAGGLAGRSPAACCCRSSGAARARAQPGAAGRRCSSPACSSAASRARSKATGRPIRSWSSKRPPPTRTAGTGKLITVNNAGYQGMIDLDPAARGGQSAHPGRAARPEPVRPAAALQAAARAAC